MNPSLLFLKLSRAHAQLFRHPIQRKNKSVYISLLIMMLKIITFSFNYIVVILVCIAFKSSVINLI